MNRQSLSLLPIAAFVSFAAMAQSPSVQNGKAVYETWCVHCHGEAAPGPLPGTSALEIRYNGALPAVLTDRTDLAPEYIRTVVRNGLFSMPRSRKTEISDSELEDIVAYLTAGGDNE